MTVIEYMTVVGFAGLFFSAGFAIGRIVKRLINSKNNRRQSLRKISTVVFTTINYSGLAVYR